MPRLNREHLIGVSCLAIAGVMYALSAQLPKGQGSIGVSGPSLFPNILASILALSGVAQIIVGMKNSSSFPMVSFAKIVDNLKRPEVINVFIIIGLWIAYELVFVRLGFVIATLGFVFVIMVRLGVKLFQSVAISAVYVAAVYLVFTTLFSIPLPGGVLSFLGM